MTRLLKQFILTAMLALFASQASALFVQADNWDPRMQGVGTNRYAYAGGDPINMSDPNGHQYNANNWWQQFVSAPSSPEALFRESGKMMEQQIIASEPYAVGVANFALDSMDGIGDVKAFYEAETFGDYALATVGLLPYVPQLRGDIKLVRAAEDGMRGASSGRRVTQYADGTFSVSDWTDYPDGVPRPPQGSTFRLISGGEYQDARRLANNTNARLRRSGVVPSGFEIHEIIPVKYGGSPTNLDNKVFLPRGIHRGSVTPWWNRLQRDVE